MEPRKLHRWKATKKWTLYQLSKVPKSAWEEKPQPPEPSITPKTPLALRALAERYKVSVAVLKLENRQYTWSKTGNFSQEIRLFLRDNHYELLYGNLVMI
jgi:hypothetical protein